MSAGNGVVEEAVALLDVEREVHLDRCICPDGGHGEEGDTITLRETLDYTSVRAIRYAGSIARDDDPDSSIASLMAVMSEQFLLHGIQAWTLRDKRQPIPVEKATIRRHLLTDMEAAMIVGDYADAIYQAQVLHPLAGLARRSSQPSPTNESTSPPTAAASKSPAEMDDSSGKSSSRSAKRPKQSRPSSTTSIPTDFTAETTFDSAGGSTS